MSKCDKAPCRLKTRVHSNVWLSLLLPTTCTATCRQQQVVAGETVAPVKPMLTPIKDCVVGTTGCRRRLGMTSCWLVLQRPHLETIPELQFPEISKLVVLNLHHHQRSMVEDKRTQDMR